MAKTSETTICDFMGVAAVVAGLPHQGSAPRGRGLVPACGPLGTGPHSRTWAGKPSALCVRSRPRAPASPPQRRLRSSGARCSREPRPGCHTGWGPLPHTHWSFVRLNLTFSPSRCRSLGICCLLSWTVTHNQVRLRKRQSSWGFLVEIL